LGACGAKTDAQFQQEAVTGMHDSLLADINNLVTASQGVQAVAPLPTDRGWDDTADAAAITAMKASWIQARTAYEHIEGALAPLFPDIDFSIDARYDDFLAALNGVPDTQLFDGQGVTGLHAVERILYAPVTPQNVITFESKLTGYEPASYPTNPSDAATFQTGLCAKMLADAQTLQTQWTPQKIDLDGAFQGLVSLMEEQREKVNKAATFEEESRYSQRTLADIRDNLAGTQKIYGLFSDWLKSKSTQELNGAEIDANIEAGFAKLSALYATYPGDAIPAPPETWSAENPSEEDLATPFGLLYAGVNAQSDASQPDSIVAQMNNAAVLLGLPPLND
jgi:iron uptake system component EfeO